MSRPASGWSTLQQLVTLHPTGGAVIGNGNDGRDDDAEEEEEDKTGTGNNNGRQCIPFFDVKIILRRMLNCTVIDLNIFQQIITTPSFVAVEDIADIRKDDMKVPTKGSLDAMALLLPRIKSKTLSFSANLSSTSKDDGYEQNISDAADDSDSDDDSDDEDSSSDDSDDDSDEDEDGGGEEEDNVEDGTDDEEDDDDDADDSDSDDDGTDVDLFRYFLLIWENYLKGSTTTTTTRTRTNIEGLKIYLPDHPLNDDDITCLQRSGIFTHLISLELIIQ